MFFWHKKFAENINKEFSKVLLNPDELLKKSEIIKDDKSTTVGKFEWQDKQYIIKRFNARNKGHAIKRSLRRSRANNCWYMSLIFLKYSIAVAKPIAMLERRAFFLKADSFFISEHIDGVEILGWLPEQESSMQIMVKQQMIEIFTIFAKNRLSHGDMKATNLLWSGQKIALIDLDAAKQHSNNILFARAHARDKRRFSRNGVLFAGIMDSFERKN